MKDVREEVGTRACIVGKQGDVGRIHDRIERREITENM